MAVELQHLVGRFRRRQNDRKRPLILSDIDRITRLSEVVDGLLNSGLIPDDSLRTEMATLFTEPGILRSLGQCVDDRDAVRVIALATQRLQSQVTLTIYYKNTDDNIQPYLWPTPSDEQTFRSLTLDNLRKSFIRDDGVGSPAGHRQSEDPLVIKGEALAQSLRVLQVVPYRCADDITIGSFAGIPPQIQFRSSTV